MANKPSKANTIARQLLQGSSLGFADEAYDRLGALYASKMGAGNYEDLLNEARGLSKEELSSDIKNNPKTAIAANILGGLPAGVAAGAKVIPQMALGGLAGMGSSDQDLRNSFFDGAVGAGFSLGGQAVSSGLSRVAKGASDLITPEVRKVAQNLKSMGIPVRLSQLMDSKFLSAIDSALPKVPFSGAGASQDAQRRAFTKRLASTFGENADNINPDVLSSAKTRLGSEYSGLLDNVNIPVDRRQFAQQLSQLVGDISLETDDAGAAFLSKQADNILNTLDKGNGTLSGTAYQKLRQTLKGARGTNYSVGEIQKFLDNAVRNNVPDDIGKKLGSIDTQYRNMKIAEKLYGQLQNSSGEIKPETLYNVAKSYISDLAYGGGGELGDLARSGRLLKPTIPDSGTATQALGMGALGGAATGAYFDPTIAVGTVGAIGAAKGLNKAMTSNYLQEGLSPVFKNATGAINNSGVVPSVVRGINNTQQDAQPQLPQELPQGFSMAQDLPPGFAIRQPSQTAGNNLPPGFVIKQ